MNITSHTPNSPLPRMVERRPRSAAYVQRTQQPCKPVVSDKVLRPAKPAVPMPPTNVVKIKPPAITSPVTEADYDPSEPDDRTEAPDDFPIDGAAADTAATVQITQAQLEAYRQIAARCRAVRREFEEQRRRLLVLSQAGVPVAPGKLDLSVRQTSTRRFTHAKLLQVLGQDEYETMVAAIAPSISWRVQVKARK